MRTVRRLYFYAMGVISLEVVIWGVIGLVRTIVKTAIGGQTNLFAGSLALVFVGLPVFLIHWWAIQSNALKDPEERATRVRSIFLYGIIIGVLIPVVQNALALSNRLVLILMGLQWSPLVGKGQTWADNLIAIAINLGAAAYFIHILREDWKVDPPGNSLSESQRLYRYIWLVYSLGITVFGIQQVIRYIMFASSGLSSNVSFMLADGIALLIVGTPVWVINSQSIQATIDRREERESILRQVVLHGLSLAGVMAFLVAAGIILYDLLNWALGASLTFQAFLQGASPPVSVAIPLGGTWLYSRFYRRKDASRLGPLIPTGTELPLTKAIYHPVNQIYTTLLAGFGLGAAIFGLHQLLAVIVSAAVSQAIGTLTLRSQLASALAFIALGVPLWWSAWRPLQLEAGQRDDPGDLARRSVIRKAYLYLAVFAGVIGVMATAGEAIYQVTSRLLGNPMLNFSQSIFDLLLFMALFAAVLVYHISALRLDGRLTGQSLASLQHQFPVLIITPESSSFADEIGEALKQFAPHIPFTIQTQAQGLPRIDQQAPKAVILPSVLATTSSGPLQDWLHHFQGQLLVVPVAQPNWQWIGMLDENSQVQARQAANAVRQMAEDQPVRFSPAPSPWVIVGYILGGFFGLEVLSIVLIFGISLFH